MSSVQIPNLPPVIALSGSEQIECVQAGTSSRTTTGNISAYTIEQLQNSQSSSLPNVTTVAALRGIPPVSNKAIVTLGYYAVNDGGQAEYYGVTGASAGTYVDNGTTVIVPTYGSGSNGSAAWIYVNKGVINVRQFGARGNGSTDDTTAFTAAVNYGSSVYVPDGTFMLNALNIPSNTKFFGAGSARTTIKGANSTAVPIFINGSAPITGVIISDICFLGTVLADGFAEQVHLMRAYNVNGFTVQNCSFLGPRGDGIYLGTGNSSLKHNYNVLIQGNLFDGLNNDNRNAISVIDCTDLIIDNNTFLNFTRNGTQVIASAITATSPGPLTGITLSSGGGTGFINGATVLIDAVDGSGTGAVGRVVATGGVISVVNIQSGGSNYTNGEAVYVRQMGQPGAIDFEPNQTYEILRNCTVTNNTFKNCLGNVATVSITLIGKAFTTRPKNFLVSNNIIDSCINSFCYYDLKTGGKTITDEDDNFIFSNNQVTNCGSIGFVWGCKTGKITNNVFSSPVGGMSIGFNAVAYKSLYIDVTNNKFMNCASSNCVYTFWADYVDIIGNLFSDCGTGNPGASNAMDFGSNSTSSYVRINNNTFVSPLGKTAVAIQVEATHTLSPSTNQFYENYVGVNGLTSIGLFVLFQAVNSDFLWTAYTPIIVGASSAGTGTYTSQYGAYQKIGKLVNFQAKIVQTAHTGTGQVAMQLPTLAVSTAGNAERLVPAMFASNNAGAYAAGSQVIGIINPAVLITSGGVTYGAVRFYYTNNTTTTFPGNGIVVQGNATYVISGTYEAQ